MKHLQILLAGLKILALQILVISISLSILLGAVWIFCSAYLIPKVILGSIIFLTMIYIVGDDSY